MSSASQSKSSSASSGTSFSEQDTRRRPSIRKKQPSRGRVDRRAEFAGEHTVRSSDGSATTISYIPEQMGTETGLPSNWELRDSKGELMLTDFSTMMKSGNPVQIEVAEALQKRFGSDKVSSEVDDLHYRIFVAHKELGGRFNLTGSDGEDTAIEYRVDQVDGKTGTPKTWSVYGEDAKEAWSANGTLDQLENDTDAATQAVARHIRDQLTARQIQTKATSSRSSYSKDKSSRLRPGEYSVDLTDNPDVDNNLCGSITVTSSDDGLHDEEKAVVEYSPLSVDPDTGTPLTWKFAAKHKDGVWLTNGTLDQLDDRSVVWAQTLARYVKDNLSSSGVGSATTATDKKSVKEQLRKGLYNWMSTGIARADTEDDEGGATSTELSASWKQQSREVATAA